MPGHGRAKPKWLTLSRACRRPRCGAPFIEAVVSPRAGDSRGQPGTASPAGGQPEGSRRAFGSVAGEHRGRLRPPPAPLRSGPVATSSLKLPSVPRKSSPSLASARSTTTRARVAASRPDCTAARERDSRLVFARRCDRKDRYVCKIKFFIKFQFLLKILCGRNDWWKYGENSKVN